MRRDIEEREPDRDVALAAVLRQAYSDAPLAPERADALRRRIRDSAEGLRARPARFAAPLAAAPVGAALRRRFARLSNPAPSARGWGMPALAAAALVALLAMGELLFRQPSPIPVPAVRAVGFASPEQALSADMSDADFARVITRQDDPAALLDIAVAPPGHPATP